MRLLRKLTQKNVQEWVDCLPFVLWEYQGTIHSSSGFSPYEHVFGRTMKTPLDELSKYWKGKREEKDMEVVEYLRLLKEKLDIVREMATTNEKLDIVREMATTNENLDKVREMATTNKKLDIVREMATKNEKLDIVREMANTNEKEAK